MSILFEKFVLQYGNVGTQIEIPDIFCLFWNEWNGKEQKEIEWNATKWNVTECNEMGRN
jgi:hypothetical protein